MVKIGKNEKRLCNGKLVITDFKRLNPKSFTPLYDFTKNELSKEFAVFAPDGTMYINSKMYGNDLVSAIFEIIMQESRKNLEKAQKAFSEKYPNVHDFNEWGIFGKTAGDEEIKESLCMLLIPIEIKRREIEKSYYC